MKFLSMGAEQRRIANYKLCLIERRVWFQSPTLWHLKSYVIHRQYFGRNINNTPIEMRFIAKDDANSA